MNPELPMNIILIAIGIFLVVLFIFFDAKDNAIRIFGKKIMSFNNKKKRK